MRRPTTRVALVLAAGLVLSACGGEDPVTADPAAEPSEAEGTDADGDDHADDEMDDMDDMASDDGMDMGGGYGEPADASEADRTIEVTVDNAVAFEPAEFEVAAGEVITFLITNTGDIEHEFVLGDEQAQQQMAAEMAEDDGHAHSGEMSNAVTVHGGESAELTWRFPTEPTTVLIGCHVPGHYDAGMRGTVAVG